VPGRESLLLP